MTTFGRFQLALYEHGRRMRQPFVLKDRYFLSLLGVLTVLALAHFLYIIFFVKRLPPIIILHENLYFGIDRIGSWYSIFFFPTLELFFSLINTAFASAIFGGDRALSYILMAGGVVASVILFIGGIFVLRSNL